MCHITLRVDRPRTKKDVLHDGQRGWYPAFFSRRRSPDKPFTVLIVSPYNDRDHELLSAAMADCR